MCSARCQHATGDGRSADAGRGCHRRPGAQLRGPDTRPAAIAGMKMAKPNTAMAARMHDAAWVSVISPVGRMSV
jgi:hypothetical protein